MKIYHGSEFEVKRPQYGLGRRANDYGLGFYCTDDKSLAGEWSVSPLHDGLSMPEVRRESKADNALFFLCSLIEYIARQTRNRRIDVINRLGDDRLCKIFDLADIYHSDNIERVASDFIEEAQVPQGEFDNVSSCRYAVPTFWEIGRVYQRLVLAVASDGGESEVEALRKVYSSFMADKIDDYNSSVYYDSPERQFADYKAGQVSPEP